MVICDMPPRPRAQILPGFSLTRSGDLEIRGQHDGGLIYVIHVRERAHLITSERSEARHMPGFDSAYAEALRLLAERLRVPAQHGEFRKRLPGGEVAFLWSVVAGRGYLAEPSGRVVAEFEPRANPPFQAICAAERWIATQEL